MEAEVYSSDEKKQKSEARHKFQLAYARTSMRTANRCVTSILYQKNYSKNRCWTFDTISKYLCDFSQ